MTQQNESLLMFLSYDRITFLLYVMLTQMTKLLLRDLCGA